MPSSLASAHALQPFATRTHGCLAEQEAAHDFGIVLRVAADGDLPALCDLYATTRLDIAAMAHWPDEMRRQFIESQFAAQHRHYLAAYPEADFLVLERDGVLIGRYYLQREPPDDLVVDISLLPGARGRGVATALLGATQHRAARAGRGVTLHVQVQNVGAQRLYARLGFTVVDEHELYRQLRWGAAHSS